MIQAFVAAEDDTFYEHSGIDYLSHPARRLGEPARRRRDPAGRQHHHPADGEAAAALARAHLPPQDPRDDPGPADRGALHQGGDPLPLPEPDLLRERRLRDRRGGAHLLRQGGRRSSTRAEAALLAGLPKAPARYSPFLQPRARPRSGGATCWTACAQEGFIDEATYAAGAGGAARAAPPPEREAYADGGLLHRGGAPHPVRSARQRPGAPRRATRRDHPRPRAPGGGGGGGRRRASRTSTSARATAARCGASTPGEIEAERARLAEENQLEPDEEEAPRRASRSDRPLLGVVLVRGRRSETARGRLRPGSRGPASLSTTSSWARPADPTSYRAGREVASRRSSTRATWRGSSCEPDATDAEGRRRAARAAASRSTRSREVQGALLSFDVADGDVLALVGGYDFDESEFNRVTQARRQPGSAFKPIIYARRARQGLHAGLDHLRPPGRLRRPGVGLHLAPGELRRRFLGPPHHARGAGPLGQQRHRPPAPRRRRRLRDRVRAASWASSRRWSGTSAWRSARTP